MLDLARHIANQNAGRFEPEKFEDQYESALIELINQKRAGKTITPKERPWRKCHRLDGCAAQECRQPRPRDQGHEKACSGSEGNADANRGHETYEATRGEEAGEAAAQVSVKYPGGGMLL